MKIAISGKGGVGKTYIASTLAWAFAREGRQTLAIDIDSSPNLGLSLGLSPEEVRKILPLSENREMIDQKTLTEFPGVFRLNFPVDDVLRSAVLPTPGGPGLLVMGTVRSMGSGCACPAHTLAQALIRHLVIERNGVVVMDMEAGLEHLGRGTARQVDILLVVTDATVRARETCRSIAGLARDSSIGVVGIVGNRIRDREQEQVIRDTAESLGLPVPGLIPYDGEVARAEISGDTSAVFLDTPARRAVLSLKDRIVSLVECRQALKEE